MNTAKLFKNGESQAVRLPKEYRFKGSEVYITKHSNVVMLIPKSKNTWDIMKEAVGEFSEDIFAEGRQQPEEQVRSGL
ncbi:type II toxin-antitoxin system antitoxin VapB [Turneriella parva]|jgi:antitoxin VapB|uniref:SpoVT/AbrB domain-containing protein n=1 Tax=Turneriella parva (strain ATCC BAA-1111 / DSM 21527 / NCTC 11395 / H) TaxID=869212 RepID=I4B4A0_TURPD|nr:type II toxin-antitoxin system VapB family antitoxin [Turneriella parva]AFM12107.1 SpoVT/AbrB domain-containing protein [Turneriella parva DSM 21527]